MMNHRTLLVRAALLSAVLAGGASAFAAASDAAPARKAGTRQTHHCKLPDGTMDMSKTHRACLAAKGTWARDAASAPAAAASPAGMK